MKDCTVCGASVGLSDRYCSRCGSCISQGEPVPEYHFVTIVCTDLSGYSMLSERLDQEELRAFMDKVLGEITRVIWGFGGIVEKYIGDAVLAIFGNTKAREDDPIRGILAAREIHGIVEGLNMPLPNIFNIRLNMHTGINTGEVLVDSGTDRTSSHGTLGKPINIASRLCDMASAGEILIGEALVSEAMRYFHLEWMGKKLLKGFRKPINVYKVIHERKIPLTIHRVGGVTSLMVGREHELSILLSKARDLESGKGGVTCIIGDAGVGKSRLIEEFKVTLDEGLKFITATCFDHTSSTPYFPFSRLVQVLLGLDSMHGSTQEIAQALTLQGLSGEYAAYLAFFMDRATTSGGESPDILKEKGSDAMLWLLSSAALNQPTIFCIEDIHWADQSTLDLLTYLIHRWDKSCPCLLILTHRHGVASAFPGARLILRELGEPEVGAMLKHMLDAALVHDTTVSSLAEATGGNPFFVEEMANYLLERGVNLSDQGQIGLFDDLPTTLYGLISSRLDHMGAASKRILQEAALIGRIFTEALLVLVCSEKDVLEVGLCEAVKNGFIQSAGEGEYIFKHEITRDVASRTLLKKERIGLHQKIALAIEDRCGSCLQDHAGELAYHFGKAQEHSKAVYYHMEAGKHCQSTGAWVEAGAHFLSAEQYLHAGKMLPGTEGLLVTIQEEIWRCYRVFNPGRAIVALEDLACYYRNKGLSEEEAFCSIRLINLYSQKGLFNKAKGCYDFALNLICDNPVLIAAAHTAFAYTYTFLGKPLDALRLLDNARPILDASDRFLYAVNVLTTLAANVWKGDMEGSRSWYEQTKRFSKAYMDIDLMADIWLAHICCLEGRFEEARRIFEDVSSREMKLGMLAGGLSYLRIQGSIYFRCRYFGDIQGARADLEAFNALGGEISYAGPLKDLYRAWIALENDKPGQAKELINTALPGLRDGVANRVPYALNALAEACHLLGDHSAALSTAQESITWNEQRGNIDQLIWALRVFAEICTSQGQYDTAHKALSRAYALARSSMMKPHLAWLIASWGNLLKATGKSSKARRCFGKSLKLWKEMGNPLQEKRMAKELK
jgi:class 3 adenylate cyclase/tetratricopeptide (TPR) repeat protein